MADTTITDTDTGTTDFYERSVAGTDEGVQQLRPRSEQTAKELMREVETWIEAEMRRLDPEAYPETASTGA